MNRVAVVYWSGTGHTQAMAEAVAGACGGKLMTAVEFSPTRRRNMTSLPSDAPPWARRCWRKASSSPCLTT